MSIILDKVSFTYDKEASEIKYIINNLSLQINDGEFIGLIGHTGSGKSTLVQLFNALLTPTKGNIYYNGADIHDKEYNRRLLRSKVGLVFQYPEHQLFEETVFKDVCFGPKNMGLSEKDASLKAFEALEKVGLSREYHDQSPFDLSGGQKRRVAIAGVLAMKPEVFILDEPTAGLDPKGRDEILDLIKKLQREMGMTIILVSHCMEDVANYVDRILVMDKGSLKYDGTPKEVFKHADELEELGLSAPESTYIVRELKKRGLNIETDATTVEEARNAILRCLSGK